MNKIDDLKPIESKDGSFTLYSEEFSEHYHSVKDGALSESLYKHVIPALSINNKSKLIIFDSNFGLGFNTLTTIYSLFNSDRKVEIYSTEIDKELISKLKNFPYPKIFNELKDIIEKISNGENYDNGKFKVNLYIGDTREFLEKLENIKFDIVYQDAFSPNKSPRLWSVEYFALIKKSMSCDGILTTYSTSTPVRLALHENGFKIYSYKHEKVREGTIASIREIPSLIEMNMEQKRSVSSKGESIKD